LGALCDKGPEDTVEIGALDAGAGEREIEADCGEFDERTVTGAEILTRTEDAGLEIAETLCTEVCRVDERWIDSEASGDDTGPEIPTEKIWTGDEETEAATGDLMDE